MSFLKVKRKNEDDPKEVFILAKRSKFEDVEVPVFELTSSCVEDSDIDSVINKTITNRCSIKTRTLNLQKIRTKLREENAERSKESKLKILNHFRKLDGSSTGESVAVPVIDLSDNDTETDENGNKYVYDLYYSSTFVDFSNPEAIEDYCLREIDDELCMKEESDDELNDDDEDSNDENYWMNDYPDEADEEDEDPAAFLSRQLKNSHLNSDYSLSSSEFDESDFYSPKSKNDYYNEVVSDSESE